MDRTLDGAVMRATIVLLAGGLSLVAAGTAGIDGSIGLVFALGLVSVGVGLAATALDDSESEFDVRRVLADLWIGPALAAVIVVVWLGATPGEVQALGGLVGLLGMLNYFLRPFYHLVYGLGQRFATL